MVRASDGDAAFFPAPAGKRALHSLGEAGADGAAATGCGETLVLGTAELPRVGPLHPP